ncbi:hypothetical protein KH5H1_42600 [Corallococcus caeni]|uniref:hypothetical protein n=1 Tax=Corallococcus caeni TaxID=3082388 RepID=UPI002956AAC7|nr:hypothetical protein KH5H1_42600 [Corallococcus sp. KH5-1]
MREAEAWSRRGTRRRIARPRPWAGLLLTLVLAGVLLPLPRAEAFPIAPWTLWELTETAELVVWADVEKVMDLLPPKSPEEKRERDRWDDSEVAYLRVREVWRGQARPDEQLKVYFNGSYLCPAPPHYEPGQAVIAFLKREGGLWRTVALSYGTRYPESDDELAAYRRAVTRFRVTQEQAIVARAAGRGEAGVQAALTDWQVLAAEHPATRWDGLYGLVPASDADLWFYDPRSHAPPHLFPAHREQLARAFVTAPSLDRTSVMMLTVLHGHISADVDDTAARVLETVLAEERPPYWALSAFDLLRERYGEKPEARSEQTQDPLLRAHGDATDALPLLQQWQHFKQRHHLAPERLPLPAGPGVPGTGANTTL